MGIDKLGYVQQAEKVILKLKEPSQFNRRGGLQLTTSKIRGILSMVSELYNETRIIQGEILPEDLQSRVQYLKMRIAYESGRENDKKEKPIRDFIGTANLMNEIDSIGSSKEKLILFCRYMEALVAYHKFYGGND